MEGEIERAIKMEVKKKKFRLKRRDIETIKHNMTTEVLSSFSKQSQSRMNAGAEASHRITVIRTSTSQI